MILEKVLQLNHPKAIEIYTRSMLNIYRAQGIEISWRENFICPSESEYKRNCILKCSGYENLVVNLMQLFSEKFYDFSRLLELLCWHYHVSNDLSSFEISEYSEGKDFCDDLSEGKFNFPIIHAAGTSHRQQIFSKYLPALSQTK